ncbi:SdpI family protein [Actinomadura sp. 1N219]|uniref:SdpI family protein n=1 Tax=Actinomadura sp. 1N219 TaxID=3375152 RepID=UPI0037B64245
MAMNHLPAVLMTWTAGLLLATGWLTLTGRLPPNHLLGIRTRRTLADPAAWHVAHQAAGPWVLAAGMADLLFAAALLTGPPAPVTAALCGAGVLLTVILLVVAAASGVAALGRRTGHPDSRRDAHDRGR